MHVDVVGELRRGVALVDQAAQFPEVVDARHAFEAGLAVEQLVDAVDVEAGRAGQVPEDAGIEVTAPGAHDQALQRGQAHRGVDRAATAHGRRRGAVAEVEDDLAQPRRVAVE
ncbi:Uncharacterised protein [Mycobacteroides abscessus subsp. abscessus]|nr:Uncharacterised protein [Mycobacteroides abscessus subsp. abscessus]